MTITPQYAVPPGTQITVRQRTLQVNRRHANGYEALDVESGEGRFIPFAAFAAALKAPGTRLMRGLSASTSVSRLGEYETVEALSPQQRKAAEFHHALCKGMEELRARLVKKQRRPGLNLSIRMLNAPANREKIVAVAQGYFDERIRLQPRLGGKSADWTLYQGRTLRKYWQLYQDLPPDVDPLEALVCRDDRKGNRQARLGQEVCELMTQAWEAVGLDLKNPSVASVSKHLEMFIAEKNRFRQMNELPGLVMPSAATLKAHRDLLVDPTAYEVATMGERHARNTRGRGSTDIRALLPGEYVEIDEYKFSLVTVAKVHGLWANLSSDHRSLLRKTDTEIQKRWQLLYMIDVASRMPLAWVIAERQGADATMALLRMATRDKTEEKVRYGCRGDVMPAIGLGNIKSDNGTGLRNAEVVEAIVGLGAQSTIARTYASTDKPFVERMFGTLEDTVLRTLHGYTGRKAGELPGYDATANGVLDVEQLYGILTRYFIDEYPSTCHYGIGMWGQRPIEVFKKLNRERGCFPPIDPNLRRIRLGWEDKVTPTDEGVRVFTGIWFNSAELQRLREEHRIQGKVSVFVDPDNLAHATVVLPKVETAVEVQLQMTLLKSMTLAQFLAYVARVRKESPAATEIHEQRIMQVRRERHDLMQAIGVEKGLPRSYVTAEEAKKKAKVVLAGAKLVPSAAHDAFDIGASPDAITDLSTDSSPQTYKVAGADLVMDATITPEDTARKQRASAPDHVKEPTKAKAPELKPEASQKKKPNKQNSGHLGRPVQIKDLE